MLFKDFKDDLTCSDVGLESLPSRLGTALAAVSEDLHVCVFPALMARTSHPEVTLAPGDPTACSRLHKHQACT